MGQFDWLVRRRRTAVGLAGAVVVGAATYSFALKPAPSPVPFAELRRNDKGQIVPPKFPAVKTRAEQLAELRRRGSAQSSEPYDLLVIGGGATGTGIALDAITRGLKVALVEREDFASGTSSKSTKLVHGGVRYLEKAVWNLDYSQLELVIEALHERKTFLNIAPHLSSSLPILLPLHSYWQVPYMWAGVKTYDLLAGSQRLEQSYYVSRKTSLEKVPWLRDEHLLGSLVYYDGQHNDARMNATIAMTAALCGATMVNYASVSGLEKDAQGRITGATVRDSLDESAPAFTVKAKGVINATGPFTDAVHQMDDPNCKPIVAPASGTHIMLPKELCPNGMGILDAATSDGRVIYVLPWQGYVLAGTTDNACPIEQHPVPQQEDVDFILKETNKLLRPDAALSRDDVLASWTGIRPLVKNPNSKNTESLVRNHLIHITPSGLLTCTGGKWTTYRQMAEDAVDAAVKEFSLSPKHVGLPDVSGAGLPPVPTSGKCVTRAVGLVGAHGWSAALPAQLAELYPGSVVASPDVAAHLASDYGDRAWAVAALATAADAGADAARLLPGQPFIEAEVRYGARSESACTAVDVMARRTRMAFLDVEGALAALPRVIDLMAEELAWSPARKQAEWTSTVSFLGSMGLSAAKQGITREQVLAAAGSPSPASSVTAAAAVSPADDSATKKEDASWEVVDKQRIPASPSA